MSSDFYLVLWGIYLLAGAILIGVLWSWMRWKKMRWIAHLVSLLIAVVLFTPATLDAVPGQIVPALFALTFDSLLGKLSLIHI